MSPLIDQTRRAERPDDTDDGIALHRQAFREIRLLLAEMDEILHHAAARYDLFPRVAGAIKMTILAEEASLYEVIARAPALREKVADGRAHHIEILELVQSLEHVRGKDEQSSSAAWRRGFAQLKRNTEALLQHEESFIFEAVETELGTWAAVEIGKRYREALRLQARVAARPRSRPPRTLRPLPH